MIFAGIDVNIITHEKALAAGIEAFGLWTWCMCYAQLHETDGRIPRVAILSALGEKPRNLRRALVRLCSSGLLNETDSGELVLRNYGAKNQTAEQIEERRKAKQERNAFNQRASRDRRHRLSPGDNAVTVTDVTGSPPEPEPTPEPSPVIGTDSAPPTPPPEPITEVRPSRRRPETPCPPSEASAETVAAWASGWRVPADHPEFSGWLDHHRKSDARWRDWAAAWRTWLKNASRFGQPRTLFANRHVQSGDNRAWKLPEEMP